MVYELKILAGAINQRAMRTKSLTLALGYIYALHRKGYTCSLKRVKA